MWWIDFTDYLGNRLGEVANPTNREFSFLLNRGNTFSFRVALGQPYINTLMSSQVFVRIWRGSTLMQHGIVIGSERVIDGDEKSVSITGVDPWWVLQHRLSGKSATGVVYTALTDRGTMAKEFIDTANSEFVSTGIRTGTLASTSGSTSTYASGVFKPTSEVIADLSVGVYGFDWELVPILYTTPGTANGYITDWHAAPVLGTARPDVKFEYGPAGAGNAVGIHDVVDAAGMANAVYHFTDSGPDAPGAPTVSQADFPSISAYGLREDVAQASLIDQGLRQALVDEHVRVRRNPKRVVTFQPRPHDYQDPHGVPVYGEDYFLGDFIQAQAYDAENEWFDATFRVYGYVAKPDGDGGVDAPDLLLVDDS